MFCLGFGDSGKVVTHVRFSTGFIGCCVSAASAASAVSAVPAAPSAVRAVPAVPAAPPAVPAVWAAPSAVENKPFAWRSKMA